ncbi:MAG: S-adenosyl methyltransferase [Actinomycetia bacterium]|nr:S-adenosyl methyltransferase [Actinomycetes bacterium]
MLLAILHYIPDLAEARRIVATLVGAVPAGSFLAISHAGTDLLPDNGAYVRLRGRLGRPAGEYRAETGRSYHSFTPARGSIPAGQALSNEVRGTRI